MFYFFTGVIFSLAVIYILLNTYFKKFINTIYEGKLIIADLEDLYEKILFASDDMVKKTAQKSEIGDFHINDSELSKADQSGDCKRIIEQEEEIEILSKPKESFEVLKESDLDHEKFKDSNNDKNKKVVQLLLSGKSEKEVAKILKIELDQIELIKKIFSK